MVGIRGSLHSESRVDVADSKNLRNGSRRPNLGSSAAVTGVVDWRPPRVHARSGTVGGSGRPRRGNGLGGPGRAPDGALGAPLTAVRVEERHAPAREEGVRRGQVVQGADVHVPRPGAVLAEPARRQPRVPSPAGPRRVASPTPARPSVRRRGVLRHGLRALSGLSLALRRPRRADLGPDASPGSLRPAADPPPPFPSVATDAEAEADDAGVALSTKV